MLINRICIQTVYHNRSDGIDLHSMDSNQNGTCVPWLDTRALIPTSHFVYIMSTFVDYPIPLYGVSNSQVAQCRTMRCQHVSITEPILTLFLNLFKNILLHYLFIFCSHVGNNACLIET